MANQFFPLGAQGILDGSIDVVTASIKALLVNGYTVNGTHEFVSDMTGAGGVIAATSPAFTTKTETSGVFGADNITFAAVPAGTACNMIILIQSSAVGGGADVAASAQRLIASIDTATGLPVTPNGGDINVSWDTGANKIFKI